MKHPLFALAGRVCLMAAIMLTAVAAVHMWQIGAFLALYTRYLLYRRGALARTSDAHGDARWCNEDEALKAGLFSGRGLFLGRFAGPPGHLLSALVRLFTLPIDHSGQAVRQFLNAWTLR